MPKKVAKKVANKSKKVAKIALKPKKVASKSKKVANKSKKVVSKSNKAVKPKNDVRVKGMKLEVIGRCHNGRCVFLKRRTPINSSMLRK